MSEKYPIIRIKKTDMLENCRHKAKMELTILKRYKFLKNLGIWGFDFVFIYWYINSFMENIKENPVSLLFVLFVCFVSNVGIDHLLLSYYDNVVKKNNLEITDNMKSGSYIKFMNEIRALLTEEVHRLGKERYTLYEMNVSQTDYVCHIVIFDKE